jgi:hypothetical protein
MRVRFTAHPSSTAFFSAAGAWTMIVSTFFSLRSFRDWPEPAFTQQSVVPRDALKASARALRSPSSPGLPVARLKGLAPAP